MDQDEPHNLISTTGGMSKVKRTSHSGDDSNESKAQEPPLKRQTKLGANQADKSVGITSNETTDSNAVDTNTVDETTPAEAALQIDLVLESLFRYMHRSDLLRCRIVNKKWQDQATKELRRRKLCIKFSFRRRGSTVYRDTCRRLSECRIPSLISSLQVKTVSGIHLGSGRVKRFFTAVGNQLKHLTLHLNYLEKRSSFVKSSLMEDLQNLLCRQAPNLEFLEIKFDFPPHWEADLQTSDAFGQIQNNHNNIVLLPNLKTFIVRGSPAPKFFADVINLAVNLRSFGGDWAACSKYLLGAEGGTKIHLFKRLIFQVFPRVPWDERDIERVETFLIDHKQHLKLETLECVSDFYNEDDSIAPRVIGLINRILDCSSGSLKKLRIQPADCFDNLLIIPCLPQLQEICLDCYWAGLFCGFFPRGFNMNNSFPTVSTIVLLRCTAVLFRLFVSFMKNEMPEPTQSIRRIFVIDADEGGSSVPPLASKFHDIFPNLVSVSSVGKKKSCKI